MPTTDASQFTAMKRLGVGNSSELSNTKPYTKKISNQKFIKNVPSNFLYLNNFSRSLLSTVNDIFIYSDTTKTIITGYNGNISTVTSIIIPVGVVRISNDAFSGCNLLTSLTIPNTVTSIGDSAFSDCNSLGSLIIPNSVLTIGNSAFTGCLSLSSLNIPVGVTTIGVNAFYTCNSLGSLTIPNTVTSIGDSAFFINGNLLLQSNVSNSSTINVLGNQVRYFGRTLSP